MLAQLNIFLKQSFVSHGDNDSHGDLKRRWLWLHLVRLFLGLHSLAQDWLSIPGKEITLEMFSVDTVIFILMHLLLGGGEGIPESETA